MRVHSWNRIVVALSVLTSDRSAGTSLNIAYWQLFWDIPTDCYIVGDRLTKVTASSLKVRFHCTIVKPR